METVRPQIITVSQLNSHVKSLIDGDYKLQNIFLIGEISNFKNHIRTGHFYMTLKDDRAAVKAVMFNTYASKLKFEPRDGMMVIAFGSISVYARDGQYQFYIENMQPDGVGDLSVAFEQLKEKLEKEGLFSAQHKKPIPQYPKTVGVITSSTGAAISDIQHVLARRWPMAEVILCPTLVQGESAPAQIVSAIRRMDEEGHADVLIVARGGGSIEDLWAFNDERVARALFSCRTPVVTGVGHETDFTIADFVADRRAPTPSAAAEIAVPERLAELQRTAGLRQRLNRSMLSKIAERRSHLELLTSKNIMQSPQKLIHEKRLMVDAYADRLQRCVTDKAERERHKLSLLSGKLSAYSPLNVLSRGYSILKDENGRVISKSSELCAGKNYDFTFADGTVSYRLETKRELTPPENKAREKSEGLEER